MISPPTSPSATFKTERLQLATYLHATERLIFLGCESETGTGKVVFAFDDPNGAGPRLELEYERGAICPAAILFASQKYLRRKIDQTLASELKRNAHHYVR
jgi:hypothetical protein